MTVLNAGDVATQQPRALLDLALAEMFRFAEFSKFLTDEHEDRVHSERAGFNSPPLSVSGAAALESLDHARLPWRTFGAPDLNGDFVVLASYLPLKTYWKVLPFVFYTVQVVDQLSTAHGLLGYSLLARPLSKRFWTLSAWQNENALRAFVQQPPHVRIMAALAPHMAETQFVHWTVKGSQLPLQWDDALRRFDSE